MINKFMDALYNKWCAKLISIVIKASAKSISGDSWVKFAYTFSVYLRA
jgi:hypothetical protein